MKHLLPTLGIAALFACTPAAQAQATPPDSEDTSANPADNIVELYPENAVRKKLKLTEPDTSSGLGEGELLYKESSILGFAPYRLISTGKVILIFSGLRYSPEEAGGGQFEMEEALDLIVSSSKDGSKWDKVSVAIPRLNLRDINAGVGAVYDSLLKRVVLFYASRRSSGTGQEEADNFCTDRPERQIDKFYVSFGKGSKFSKPRDISKQFKGNEFIEQIRPNAFSTDNFQGLCLTQGKYCGRLIFLAHPDAHTVCSIYSDDHGRTWKVGTPFHFKQEGNIREMLPFHEAKDGTILVFMGRDNDNGYVLYSQDGGISWSTDESQQGQQVTYPAHRPDVYFILNSNDKQGTNSRLLAFSFEGSEADAFGSSSQVQHLTHVAISYDWGVSWPHQKTIQSSVFSTSCNIPILIQTIAPGKLGIVTSQSSGNSDIALKDAGFTTFTISWLTDGKDDGIGEVKPLAGSEGAPVDKQSE